VTYTRQLSTIATLSDQELNVSAILGQLSQLPQELPRFFSRLPQGRAFADTAQSEAYVPSEAHNNLAIQDYRFQAIRLEARPLSLNECDACVRDDPWSIISRISNNQAQGGDSKAIAFDLQ